VSESTMRNDNIDVVEQKTEGSNFSLTVFVIIFSLLAGLYIWFKPSIDAGFELRRMRTEKQVKTIEKEYEAMRALDKSKIEWLPTDLVVEVGGVPGRVYFGLTPSGMVVWCDSPGGIEEVVK